MIAYFARLSRAGTDPVIIVGDFNVAVSELDKKYFTQFVLEEFGLTHQSPSFNYSTTVFYRLTFGQESVLRLKPNQSVYIKVTTKFPSPPLPNDKNRI